jgi:hypothetical protein
MIGRRLLTMNVAILNSTERFLSVEVGHERCVVTS